MVFCFSAFFFLSSSRLNLNYFLGCLFSLKRIQFLYLFLRLGGRSLSVQILGFSFSIIQIIFFYYLFYLLLEINLKHHNLADSTRITKLSNTTRHLKQIPLFIINYITFFHNRGFLILLFLPMKIVLSLLLTLVAISQTQPQNYPCLDVPAVGCVCGQGFTNTNGLCTQQSTTSSQSLSLCPPGQRFNGATCITDTSASSNLQKSPCLPNELYVGGQCISPSGDGTCSPGSFWNGSQCTPNSNSLLIGLPQTTVVESKQQLPANAGELVCQTGYYFNCQSCLRLTGIPLCVLGCSWNGTSCQRGSLVGSNGQNLRGDNMFQMGCPSGYLPVNGRCEAMSSNTNTNTQSNPTNNQNSNIICPINYCNNGQKCVPNVGNSVMDGQYCPQSMNTQKSMYGIEDGFRLQSSYSNGQNSQLYPSSASLSNSNSNSNFNSNSKMQPLGSSGVSGNSSGECGSGFYWNGVQCTRN